MAITKLLICLINFELLTTIMAFITHEMFSDINIAKKWIFTQQQQIDHLLSMLSAVVCKENSEVLLSTGAWCMTPEIKSQKIKGKIYEKELEPGWNVGKGHIKPDDTIGHFLRGYFSGFSVIDFGGGCGQYGWYFSRSAASNNSLPLVNYLGFDGSINIANFTRNFMQWADLTIPFYSPIGPADWVLSLEVGEHIPKMYEKIYTQNIYQNCRCGAVISWGAVGQRGKGHVNNKPIKEVIHDFSSLGFTYLNKLSQSIRKNSEYWWFRKNFLIFRKNSTLHDAYCLAPFNILRTDYLHRHYYKHVGIKYDVDG